MKEKAKRIGRWALGALFVFWAVCVIAANLDDYPMVFTRERLCVLAAIAWLPFLAAGLLWVTAKIFKQELACPCPRCYRERCASAHREGVVSGVRVSKREERILLEAQHTNGE